MRRGRAIAVAWALGIVGACSAGNDTTPASTGGIDKPDAGGEGGDAGDGGGGVVPVDGGCTEPRCSLDLQEVVDCKGETVKTCNPGDACDPATLECRNACQVAADTKRSVGCEYYATFMDTLEINSCFAAFVANTSNAPAKLTVSRGGETLKASEFAWKVSYEGLGNVAYEPLDMTKGLPPGEVAVLFLAGPDGAPGSSEPVCPKPSAVYAGALLHEQSGIGQSFRIESDVPVVSYQISPYGGVKAAVTGASLLIPTSAWGTNYVAVNAAETDIAMASMNIVAMDDDTTVTLLPKAAVTGGGGIPAGPAGEAIDIVLNRGEHAQLTQVAELTGSIIASDKPVGLMAGHNCMRVPTGVGACDHGEQMVPAVSALGHEYVGVMHQPRAGEPGIWRVVGAVDGTELTWSTAVGGPTKLARGQSVWFSSADPFVVRSQDAEHPFLLFSYMSSSEWKDGLAGLGDPDFVLGVPPDQFLDRYVFMTDPTYPETGLVIVRTKVDGKFADVDLDCAGVLEGWQAVGDYEWLRVQLATGDFESVGNCSNGRHEIKSEAPFGVWVWGWSPPIGSQFFSGWVSYGYPAGMSIRPINDVEIPIIK